MTRPTLRRLRYWFDNTMSRGTPALVAWLAVVTLTMVVGVSALLVVADPETPTEAGPALHEIWKNIVGTFKLGNAANGTLGTKVLTILLAMGGIFFASTLISLITSGVEKRLEDLRKGRSQVLEAGHTVLLGWSDQVYPIIAELTVANSNQRRGCVAILADRDRTEMEDDIRRHLGKTGNTRVVCRTGSPIDPGDIDLVSPQSARSIIVLTPPGSTPDGQIAKTLLAVTNSPTRSRNTYHIVTSVRDARNHEVAQLAGGAETIVVDADDIVARIIVQTCRQSGLSVVYRDLLDFAGDEVYMAEEPALAGRTFGESLMAYRTSSVIGLQTAAGQVRINPPLDTVIAKGDRIIAISEDDDTVVLADDATVIDHEAISAASPRAPRSERFLLLGWNGRAGNIVTQLNAYVTPDTFLDIVADEADAKGELDEIRAGLDHLTVSFKLGDTDKRSSLEALDLAGYDHIIVLCYDTPDPQYSDSRALITLLHLRQMQAETGRRYSIVSEMSDDRNRKLAQVTKADDFIVSQQLISLLMVQLSENRHLHQVFEDLFDPEGSEIYLKPAEDYLVPGAEVDFYTVVEAAKRRGHVAIGYRHLAQNRSRRGATASSPVGAGLSAHGNSAAGPPTYGVRLNPDKSLKVTFGPGDKIIVIADD
jgi:voltage-gated potassium channel Kch